MDEARVAPDARGVPVRLHHVVPRWRGLALAGDATLLRRGVRIGVIGSRRPRDDTRELATRIAREAGRIGCTIVSGLAIGIDAAAHDAALSVGAPTIAVLPGGLGAVYPASNRALAARIAGQAGGARPRGLQARHDPAAPGLVALELGVPIGVIPSGVDDPGYAGSIALVRDGADAVVDGTSLFRRLELHGIMHPGFAAAAATGARIDPSCRGGWIGGGEPVQVAMLVDHPLASLLDVPRTPEELASLAGIELRDVRRMLLELEDEHAAAISADGTWTMVDQVRPAGSVV